MQDLWHPHSLSVTTPPRGHIPGSSQSALQVDLNITMVKTPRGTAEQGDRGWHYPGLMCRAGIGVSPHCSWCSQAASSLAAYPGEADPPAPQPSPSALSCTKAGGPSSLEEATGRTSFPLLCGAAALCAQPRAFIRGFLSASQAQINSAAAAALLRCSAPALLPACTELAARNRG